MFLQTSEINKTVHLKPILAPPIADAVPKA